MIIAVAVQNPILIALAYIPALMSSVIELLFGCTARFASATRVSAVRIDP